MKALLRGSFLVLVGAVTAADPRPTHFVLLFPRDGTVEFSLYRND